MFIKDPVYEKIIRLFARVVLILMTFQISYSIADVEKSSGLKSPPELIVPVDEDVARELIRNMNDGMRANLFFAKRFRIVKVNMGLLNGKTSRIKITPFRGRSTTVNMTEYIEKAPGYYRWEGEVDHGEPINKMRGLDENRRNRIRRISQVSIGVVTLYGDSVGVGPVPVPLSKSNDLAGHTPAANNLRWPIQIAQLQYYSIVNERQIKINSLLSNPNYSILVEDDTSKALGADGVDPESIRRREKFQRQRDISKSDPEAIFNDVRWEK